MRQVVLSADAQLELRTAASRSWPRHANWRWILREFVRRAMAIAAQSQVAVGSALYRVVGHFDVFSRFSTDLATMDKRCATATSTQSRLIDAVGGASQRGTAPHADARDQIATQAYLWSRLLRTPRTSQR